MKRVGDWALLRDDGDSREYFGHPVVPQGDDAEALPFPVLAKKARPGSGAEFVTVDDAHALLEAAQSPDPVAKHAGKFTEDQKARLLALATAAGATHLDGRLAPSEPPMTEARMRTTLRAIRAMWREDARRATEVIDKLIARPAEFVDADGNPLDDVRAYRDGDQARYVVTCSRCGARGEFGKLAHAEGCVVAGALPDPGVYDLSHPVTVAQKLDRCIRAMQSAYLRLVGNMDAEDILERSRDELRQVLEHLGRLPVLDGEE